MRTLLWAALALLVVACSGPQAPASESPPDPEPKESPAPPAVEDPPEGAPADPGQDTACTEGIWNTRSGPLPNPYLACTQDEECVVSSVEGCCTMTPLAVNQAYRACHRPSDGTEVCDMECSPGDFEIPASTKAACVNQVCTLQ